MRPVDSDLPFALGPGLSLAQTQEARFANFLPATLPEMQWLRRAADGLDLRSMDYVLDWRLIHRDEQKMDGVFQILQIRAQLHPCSFRAGADQPVRRVRQGLSKAPQS